MGTALMSRVLLRRVLSTLSKVRSKVLSRALSTLSKVGSIVTTLNNPTFELAMNLRVSPPPQPVGDC